MNTRSYVGAGLVAALLLLFSAATAPPTQAADGAWDIGDVTVTGCNSGEFSFEVHFVNPTDSSYWKSTTVLLGSDIYMAEYFVGQEKGASSWGLFDLDDRGIQTGVWPMPADTPFEVVFELQDENQIPVYSTRLTIDGCNTGIVTASAAGPVDTISYNGGFEDAGANNKDVDLWEESGTNDFRKCNKDKSDPPDGDFDDPEDKVFARTGECAFRFKGTAGANDKLTQVFPFPAGTTNDAVVVLFFAKANNLTGGQVLVKVKYVDGSNGKIKFDITDGTYDWQFFGDVLTFTQPIKNVKTQFRVKNGSGRVELDDVVVVVYTRAAPLILPREVVIVGPNPSFDGNNLNAGGIALPDAPSIDGVRGN